MDTFGYRFAGTENLENAIDYIIDETKKNNLQDVHTENVTVCLRMLINYVFIQFIKYFIIEKS